MGFSRKSHEAIPLRGCFERVLLREIYPNATVRGKPAMTASVIGRGKAKLRYSRGNTCSLLYSWNVYSGRLAGENVLWIAQPSKPILMPLDLAPLFGNVAVKKEDCTNQGTSTSDDSLVKSSQCLTCIRGGVTAKIHLSAEGQARPSTAC